MIMTINVMPDNTFWSGKVEKKLSRIRMFIHTPISQASCKWSAFCWIIIEEILVPETLTLEQNSTLKFMWKSIGSYTMHNTLVWWLKYFIVGIAFPSFQGLVGRQGQKKLSVVRKDNSNIEYCMRRQLQNWVPFRMGNSESTRHFDEYGDA